MVPPSIERKFDRVPAAWTWWVDDVQMDEQERLKKKPVFPGDAWARQYHIMRVFHQLIYNTDANQGNILYDNSWHLWMIDHSRAFRRALTLQDPKALTRCDRRLLENVKKLDAGMLAAEVEPWTGQPEIKGLLARRDKIVAIFEKLGPDALYDWLPER